jgi:hypothetical protein
VSDVEPVREVASAHLEELNADLDEAREQLRRSRSLAVEWERRVATLEGLLAMVADLDTVRPLSDLTLHGAMALVLSETPEQRLRAGDLASAINARRLYRMRDGRPVEPQQIHARVGHYPQLFAREGTFIRLVRSESRSSGTNE